MSANIIGGTAVVKQCRFRARSVSEGRNTLAHATGSVIPRHFCYFALYATKRLHRDAE